MLLPLLFLLLGCPHHLPETRMPAVLVAAESAPEDLTGRTAMELVETARERRLRGDLEGARYRLSLVLDDFPPSDPAQAAALYEMGLVLETADDFSAALEAYDRLVREWPEAPESVDGWFRRALCLEYLGHHRQALRSLRRIREAGLSPEDQTILDLQRGISLLRTGRTRRGLALVQPALKATEETTQVPYLRAKAYVALARLLLEEAARLDLTGSERQVTAELTERASLIQQAEKEIVAATHLEEPEWILEGLLLLGQAYEALQADLRRSPPPRSLSDAQVTYFRAEMDRRAAQLLTKAWHHYDEGVTLAERLAWEGRPLPALLSARDAIDLGSLAEDVRPSSEPVPPPDPLPPEGSAGDTDGGEGPPPPPPTDDLPSD